MTPTRRESVSERRHPEAGFSLVEVMAALVILSIALTAVFATFISQQKSFTVQNRVAEMQQNLRQAVEYLSRDIRLAGYGIPANVVIPDGNHRHRGHVHPVALRERQHDGTGPDLHPVHVRHGREPAAHIG